MSQQDLLSFARLKSDVVSVGCVRDRSATQATGELFRMLCFQEVSGNSGHKRDTHTHRLTSQEKMIRIMHVIIMTPFLLNPQKQT